MSCLSLRATGNPQPATRNRQPATGNPQPATRNRQPATRNPQPATRNPQPATRNPQPATRLISQISAVFLPASHRSSAPTDLLLHIQILTCIL
jgi:hypothetical protein